MGKQQDKIYEKATELNKSDIVEIYKNFMVREKIQYAFNNKFRMGLFYGYIVGSSLTFLFCYWLFIIN